MVNSYMILHTALYFWVKIKKGRNAAQWWVMELGYNSGMAYCLPITDIWPKPITDNQYFIGSGFYQYQYSRNCRYIGGGEITKM